MCLNTVVPVVLQSSLFRNKQRVLLFSISILLGGTECKDMTQASYLVLASALLYDGASGQWQQNQYRIDQQLLWSLLLQSQALGQVGYQQQAMLQAGTKESRDSFEQMQLSHACFYKFLGCGGNLNLQYQLLVSSTYYFHELLSELIRCSEEQIRFLQMQYWQPFQLAMGPKGPRSRIGHPKT